MATFGYTSAGGSSFAIDAGLTDRGKATDSYAATSGDVITKISGYMRTDSAGTLDTAPYTFSGGVPVTKTGSNGTMTPPNSTPAWADTGAMSTTLATDTYTLCVGAPTGDTRLYYDAETNGESFSTSTGLASSWSHLFYQNNRFSLYATYTPAAAGSDLDIDATSTATFSGASSAASALSAAGTSTVSWVGQASASADMSASATSLAEWIGQDARGEFSINSTSTLVWGGASTVSADFDIDASSVATFVGGDGEETTVDTGGIWRRKEQERRKRLQRDDEDVMRSIERMMSHVLSKYMN